MLSYEQQVQLEAQQAERLQILLDFAYREWQVADAAVTALEEKASRLIWIGLPAVLFAPAAQYWQMLSIYQIFCLGGGAIALAIATLLAQACLQPYSRPHIPSPWEIARTLIDWSDRPIRYLFIEKLAASVAELRQHQSHLARYLGRAYVFWLTGLALVLWGWIG